MENQSKQEVIIQEPTEEFKVRACKNRDCTEKVENVTRWWQCQECHEYLCDLCFGKTYEIDSTPAHIDRYVAICEDCTAGALATFYCENCEGGVYRCDGCNKNEHDKARKKSHRPEQVGPKGLPGVTRNVSSLPIDMLSHDLLRIDTEARWFHMVESNWEIFRRDASTEFVPVIGMVGKTGSGKSWMISSFVSSSDYGPVVAPVESHQSTTCDIQLYKVPGIPDCFNKMIFLDIEGDGGTTPKNLVKHVDLHPTSVPQKMTHGRQLVVKEQIPRLVYLLSDVIIFVEEINFRRIDDYRKVLKEFVKSSQKNQSTAYRPSLIIIQNKVTPIHKENAPRGGPRSALHPSDNQWQSSTATKELFENLFDMDDKEFTKQLLFDTFNGIVRCIRIPNRGFFQNSKDDEALWKAHVLRVQQEIAVIVKETAEKNKETKNLTEHLWFEMLREIIVSHKTDLRRQLINVNKIITSCQSRILGPFETVVEQLFSILYDDPSSYEKCRDAIFKIVAYKAAKQFHQTHIMFQNAEQCQEFCKETYDKVNAILDRRQPCSFKTEYGSCCLEKGIHSNFHDVPTYWYNRRSRAGTFEGKTYNSEEKFKQKTFYFLKMMGEGVNVIAEVQASISGIQSARKFFKDSLDICPTCLTGKPIVLLKCKHSFCRHCYDMLNSLDEKMRVCPFCNAHIACIEDKYVIPTGACPRILTLDGGGVRGLIEIIILKKILAHQWFTENSVMLRHLFDFVMGTSAGGIVASAVATGKGIEDMENLCRELGPKLFDEQGVIALASTVVPPYLVKSLMSAMNIPLYRIESLEGFTKAHFGETVDFSDLMADPCVPKLGVVSAVYRGSSPSKNVRLFCNYSLATAETPKQETQQNSYEITRLSEVKVFEGVTASAAAPFYFKPYQIGNYHYVDGGIITHANNPTSLALAEVQELWKCAPHQIDYIVSIGTGKLENSTDSRSSEMLTWGYLKNIVDQIFDSEASHQSVKERTPKDSYFRLNPTLDKEIALDSATKKDFDEMVKVTEQYLEQEHIQKQIWNLQITMIAKGLYFRRDIDAETIEKQDDHYQITLIIRTRLPCTGESMRNYQRLLRFSKTPDTSDMREFGCSFNQNDHSLEVKFTVPTRGDYVIEAKLLENTNNTLFPISGSPYNLRVR